MSLDADGPPAPSTSNERRVTAGDTRPGERYEAPHSTTDDDAIDRGPARASTAIAVGSAVLAAVVLPTPLALVVGLVGATLASAGAVLGARRRLGHGTLLLLAGVTLAGAQGGAPEPTLLGALLAVLAWDSGQYGIRIGEQLGREAETFRIELAHATLSATVGAAGAGLGYAAYRVVTGGQPVAAFAFLLFGAVLLAVTLR